MPSPRPTPAAVRAALSAWLAAGLPVGRLTIGPKGEIIIEAAADPKQPSDPFDMVDFKRKPRP